MVVSATISDADWRTLDDAFAPAWESYWIEPGECDDGEVYADLYAQEMGGQTSRSVSS